ITNIRGKKKTFIVSKFIEYDRIRGVGKIAHVKDGKEPSLTRLAKKLGIKEKELLRKGRKLDLYDIAILKRDFKDAFA
ncbi:MAG: hypothetical protein HY929_07225, partial [Euryarchaeota archaeon]|nr:hypothetical protein [Euryarchaeota archaeon]